MKLITDIKNYIFYGDFKILLIYFFKKPGTIFFPEFEPG